MQALAGQTVFEDSSIILDACIPAITVHTILMQQKSYAWIVSFYF